VRDLDIDLIDRINPFEAAYAVLAKTMDEKSLRQIQASIAGKTVKITEVEARIAGAENDATYLLAGVEVVAEYKLHNLSRVKMENIFHRLFGAAQLDLTIEDRFGKAVKPREWFLVPLSVIDEAVERIRNGSIGGITYDPRIARLVGLP
jgi:hypothetical protein